MRGATRSGRAGGAGLLLCLLVLAAGPATAQQRRDDAEALRISQAAVGRTLGGYAFTAADGTPLTLEQLRGRPVVLSFVYTSCYYVCPSLTLRLRETVKVARDALGKEAFSVVTVGFDTPNDTPERMGAYARERGVGGPGWYVASADAATMARVVEDTGFTYYASPKGIDHITQTTILDPQGRIVLQVYGEDFAPPSVVEPLKKLVWGQDLDRTTLRGLVNTVKLICTVYDPASGRYRFDYSLIVEIVAGALALGIAAAAILASLRNVR
jgi:protein SCO1/2